MSNTTARIQTTRGALMSTKPRMCVVSKDGHEEVIVEVDIDTWRIEDGFLAFESHDGDQIHYFIAANVARFLTYYV